MTNKNDSFRVTHSYGCTENYDTYEEACAAVRAVWGEDCAIGHPGDISEGWEETACWPNEEAAAADEGDGGKCCRIKVLHG